MILVKRVYDLKTHRKGRCFLVDRLWPRGIKKEALHLDGWFKEVAPSKELRQWFGHDAEKWNDFRSRYFAELNANPGSWQPLLKAAQQGDITLLYGASEEKYNNAVALREYLEIQLQHS